MTSSPRTLAEEITAGLAVQEALTLGMLLAERLRQLHEDGKTHSALSPAAVALEGNDVRLLSAPDDPRYSAPEVLRGEPADARSDIYSFGAILFEMLNGRAYDQAATPLGGGHPAADRLLKGCLAKSPDDRFQQVRKLMLDLRLLLSAARRSAAAPSAVVADAEVAAPVVAVAPRPINRPVLDKGAPIAARLLAQENSVARLGQIADRALKALSQQQASAAAWPLPRDGSEAKIFAIDDERQIAS